MLRQAKAGLELDELVAGLQKLKAAPKDIQLKLIDKLKTKFVVQRLAKLPLTL